MRPVTVPIGATGTDPVVVPLDLYLQGPITVAILDVDGTVDIDVEYTMADVYDSAFDQATASWFPTGAMFTGATANVAGALTDAAGNPIRPTAIRATNGAAGTANLKVTQAGLIT